MAKIAFYIDESVNVAEQKDMVNHIPGSSFPIREAVFPVAPGDYEIIVSLLGEEKSVNVRIENESKK